MISIKKVISLAALTGVWLLGAAAQGAEDAQDAQDVQIITREGQKQMLKNPGTEAAGAKKPDVIIVEYFDYNCPYCKKLVPDLQHRAGPGSQDRRPIQGVADPGSGVGVRRDRRARGGMAGQVLGGSRRVDQRSAAGDRTIKWTASCRRRG